MEFPNRGADEFALARQLALVDEPRHGDRPASAPFRDASERRQGSWWCSPVITIPERPRVVRDPHQNTGMNRGASRACPDACRPGQSACDPIVAPNLPVSPWTRTFCRHAIPDDRIRTSLAFALFSSIGETAYPDPDRLATSIGRRVAVGAAVDLRLRDQITLDRERRDCHEAIPLEDGQVVPHRSSTTTDPTSERNRSASGMLLPHVRIYRSILWGNSRQTNDDSEDLPVERDMASR